jgi:hypothetical protein
VDADAAVVRSQFSAAALVDVAHYASAIFKLLLAAGRWGQGAYGYEPVKFYVASPIASVHVQQRVTWSEVMIEIRTKMSPTKSGILLFYGCSARANLELRQCDDEAPYMRRRADFFIADPWSL